MKEKIIEIIDNWIESNVERYRPMTALHKIIDSIDNPAEEIMGVFENEIKLAHQLGRININQTQIAKRLWEEYITISGFRFSDAVKSLDIDYRLWLDRRGGEKTDTLDYEQGNALEDEEI